MLRIILLCFVAMLAISCSKVDIKSPDDFSVATATGSTTFTTNDVVTFTLTGNPDYITFYSGEPGKMYSYSSVTKEAADSTILNFSTTTTASNANSQTLDSNYLSVLVSADFNGIMDVASISAAQWTDISTRAFFAIDATNVPSGSVHLEDLKIESKPMYIAFRYVADSTRSDHQARKWVVPSFSLKNYFSDTAYALAGGENGTTFPISTGGFTAKSILNDVNIWSYSSTNLTFNAPAVNSAANDDWAISRPFDLTLRPADAGLKIKGMVDNPVTTYKMTAPYRQPGTYTASFVAKNQNSDNAMQVVKQVVITVTP